MDGADRRATIESIMRRAAEGGDDMSIFVDEVMAQVDDFGQDEYQRGHEQGRVDEREVHFG